MDYPVINTQWNRKASKGEVNKMKSMTVPDQAMSMREIMERYAKGLPLGDVGVYEEDEDDDDLDMVDFNRLDLAEQQELIEERKYELQELQKRLMENESKKQRKSKDEPENGSTIDFEDIPSNARKQYPKKAPPEGPPAGPPEGKTALIPS